MASTVKVMVWKEEEIWQVTFKENIEKNVWQFVSDATHMFIQNKLNEWLWNRKMLSMVQIFGIAVLNSGYGVGRVDANQKKIGIG